MTGRALSWKRAGVKKKYLTPAPVCDNLPKVIVMEEKVEQAYLYDFYGELLNRHQRKLYEAFIFQDLTLSEIADEEGISRQGVHDVIRRCTKTLADYEAKLHLVERFLSVKQKAGRIRDLAEQSLGGQSDAVMEEIRQISGQILEEL